MTQQDKKPETEASKDLPELFDDLSTDLSSASMCRIEYSMMRPEKLKRLLGDDEWGSLVARTGRAALMLQTEALSEFILEVAGIPVVESKRDLLGTKSYEVDGFSKFPNLRVLTALFEAGGDGGSKFDVGTRFFKRLTSVLH